MGKIKILYLSTNDGSDMRINKEIKTLSQKADIYFLGVGQYSKYNYAKIKCKEFYLIDGKRNSVNVIIKHIKKYLEWNKLIEFDSIHIINEQLMIFFYPFLFKKHVVLDIFDSAFMKLNRPNEEWKLLKKITYSPIKYILVTDENRYRLMPSFVRNKLRILENYPNLYKGRTIKKNSTLTIFYNGSMTTSRGTLILKRLLDYCAELHVIMAGWIADNETEQFSKHDRVDFRGILTQQAASTIAATEADYIMCCYEPSNQNNINASPNKIYDAMQTRTPVIINSEVKVSQFVIDEKIGVVLPSFYDFDTENFCHELQNKKGSFEFKDENTYKYSWESIENKLLNVHNIKF